MLLALTLLIAAATQSAEPSADESAARELITRLAKPIPATIDFTEVRFSPLLQQPVIVSGTLGYAGPATLDRHVTQPYREDTEIRGESVLVRREGEPERSFALKRAPELQGLLTAFTSLLAGNYPAVERAFTIVASGNHDGWQIALAPRDARMAKRVKQIRIDGHSDVPRCFSIINANDSASMMLLGAATHTELPQPLTRDWLVRRCGAGNE
jgi:hypothetical protein